MEKLYSALLVLALIGYGFSMTVAFINLFHPLANAFTRSRQGIAAGLAAHALAFACRCFAAGTLAVSSLHESLSFFALLLALAFLLLTRKRPLPMLAAFTSPLLIVFFPLGLLPSPTPSRRCRQS